MKPIRVGTTVSPQQHKSITKIVEESKSTVGQFLSLAVQELIANPKALRKLPPDPRRASA